MKINAHLALGVALMGAAALVTGAVDAATVKPVISPTPVATAEIKLPQEVAKLRPSTLPGYAIAMQKCAICHSADYVSYQPPGMSQVQWTAEMAKMQHAYGAPISDDEVRQIGAYLAVAYGSAKASDASVVAASSPAVATPAPASSASGAASSNAPVATVSAPAANAAPTGELLSLLNSNACLSCHAIAQKIVGPAFRDVAAKYKGDAQAVSRLETSIRKGSVGKWGDAPMPPFSALTDPQVKALAHFVMQQ